MEENYLIKHCLQKLNNEKIKEKIKENINKVLIGYGYKKYIRNEQNFFKGIFASTTWLGYEYWFEKLSNEAKTVIVLAFLSNTPDGNAVMPFLKVKTKDNIKNLLMDLNIPIFLFSDIALSDLQSDLQSTLLFVLTYLLSQNHKFDEILEILNKIYMYGRDE